MNGDGGETLIEILLSTMILGIAVSALLFGLGAAATTGGFHKRQAQQAESLQNVLDALQAAPYVDCASSYTVTSALVPAGYTVSASVIGYASGAGFLGSCAADEGVQRVRVEVFQSDSRVRKESVVVGKRKPCTALPC